MPSKLNEALMAVIDAVIIKTNHYHSKDEKCSADLRCGHCRTQEYVLAVSEDLWEVEGEELDVALDTLLLNALPDVPAPMRKIALQKCKQKIEELIEISGDDESEVSLLQ